MSTWHNHFQMDDLNEKIGWGKYARFTLGSVLRADEDYVIWMIKYSNATFSECLLRFINGYLSVNSEAAKVAYWQNVFEFYRQKEIYQNNLKLEELRRKEEEEKQKQRVEELKRQAEERERLEKEKQKVRINQYIHNVEEMCNGTLQNQIKWTKQPGSSNGAFRRERYIHQYEDKTIVLLRESFRGRESEWRHHYLLTCDSLEVRNNELANLWGIVDETEKEHIRINSKVNIVQTKSKMKQEIKFVDLVVKVQSFYCDRNHHIEDIVAVFMVTQKNGQHIEIEAPAGYCSECNCYFILNETFNAIRKKGALLCQVINEVMFRNGNYGLLDRHFYDWADESLLKIAGYSVDAKTNLTALERRLILEYLIDSGILSKNRVLSYLDYFVDLRKNMESMEDAIEKWTSDREYIATYNQGDKDHVKVGKVIKKSYLI